ncbi:MAG TPA: type II toxin-antitoxin system Phd/YefM family antitoxin [Solirubrobacteraceae bacterium]
MSRIMYSVDVAKTVPFTEARTRLSELFDEVERQQEHVIITRNGHPAAVVVSADEYEALEETLEILNDEETLAALRESEEDVQAGRVYGLDAVRRELGLA